MPGDAAVNAGLPILARTADGQRARGDMKVLAHIREHYGLSLGSYGRPRMTMELKEAGLDVGERQGRPINAAERDQASPYAASIRSRPDSNHRLGVAAEPGWMGILLLTHPTSKWAGDITLCLDRGGLALPCRYPRPAQSPRCRLGRQ